MLLCRDEIVEGETACLGCFFGSDDATVRSSIDAYICQHDWTLVSLPP